MARTWAKNINNKQNNVQDMGSRKATKKNVRDMGPEKVKKSNVRDMDPQHQNNTVQDMGPKGTNPEILPRR